MNNIDIAKKEVENALKDLQKSWIKCLIAFNNIYIDINDYIDEYYPFDKSFDDIEVLEWIENSLENLKNPIDKR